MAKKLAPTDLWPLYLPSTMSERDASWRYGAICSICFRSHTEKWCKTLRSDGLELTAQEQLVGRAYLLFLGIIKANCIHFSSFKLVGQEYAETGSASVSISTGPIPYVRIESNIRFSKHPGLAVAGRAEFPAPTGEWKGRQSPVKSFVKTSAAGTPPMDTAPDSRPRIARAQLLRRIESPDTGSGLFTFMLTKPALRRTIRASFLSLLPFWPLPSGRDA